MQFRDHPEPCLILGFRIMVGGYKLSPSGGLTGAAHLDRVRVIGLLFL